MVLVQFLRPHSPYNAGEVAGFPDEQAHRLVAHGVAQAVVPAVVAAPPMDKALHAPPLAKHRTRR